MIATSGIYYHHTSEWAGGDLLPLSARMERNEAIAEFLRRWPLCRRSQASVDIGLVYTDSSPSERGPGLGGVILAIDASKVPGGLEYFCHEDECDGGYVAERIPAEAILGVTGEAETAARCKIIIEAEYADCLDDPCVIRMLAELETA
jgi:hypothetical protein